ncbi:MAG: hypothetical protein WB762_16650 [Candidatus Sulfotelmatobacter sp.]
MAKHIRDLRQLAQEASTENDPKKLMELIHDLNEALALLRRNRKKSMSPKNVFQDKELTEKPVMNTTRPESERDAGRW